MKPQMFLTAIALILIIVAAGGCAAAQSTTSDPGQIDQPSQSGIMPRNDHFVVTADEFAANPFYQQATTVPVALPVTVVLASNGTTGFSWDANATISDTSVATQTSHTIAGPTSTDGNAPLVGAPGSETYVFQPLKAGTTTIKLEYSRPWEGGEKGVWSYTLTMTVQ